MNQPFPFYADCETFTVNTIEDLNKLKSDVKKKIAFTVNTIEDLNKLKSDVKKKIVRSGLVSMDSLSPSPEELSDIITDKFGNKLNINDFKLVVIGRLDDPCPSINHQAMQTFADAVNQTATFNQRNFSLWKKSVIIWRIFADLFLNNNRYGYSTTSPWTTPTNPPTKDPYIMAAYEWIYNQQSKKSRFSVFISRIRDMFIYRPDAENLEIFNS